MKSLFAALLVVSGSAFAFDYNDSMDVDYISWCSENKVIANNSNNELVVIADCEKAELTCVNKIVRKGRSLMNTASCQ